MRGWGFFTTGGMNEMNVEVRKGFAFRNEQMRWSRFSSENEISIEMKHHVCCVCHLLSFRFGFIAFNVHSATINERWAQKCNEYRILLLVFLRRGDSGCKWWTEKVAAAAAPTVSTHQWRKHFHLILLWVFWPLSGKVCARAQCITKRTFLSLSRPLPHSQRPFYRWKSPLICAFAHWTTISMPMNKIQHRKRHGIFHTGISTRN